MDSPEEVDKETFLSIMLKKRPEYAIVWDVHGKEVQEFHRRVWVTQYVVVDDQTVYYSQSRHYATRAKALFNLEKIILVEQEEDWERYLPADDRFKTIKYYTPDLVDVPTEISREDFIEKMLRVRPLFAVVWDVDYQDMEYIVSRIYVSSIMYVKEADEEDTLYYSYGKHFAYAIQKKFNIPKRKKIDVQNPAIITE